MEEGKQSKIKVEAEEIEWTKNKIQVGTLKKGEEKGESRRRKWSQRGRRRGERE